MFVCYQNVELFYLVKWRDACRTTDTVAELRSAAANEQMEKLTTSINARAVLNHMHAYWGLFALLLLLFYYPREGNIIHVTSFLLKTHSEHKIKLARTHTQNEWSRREVSLVRKLCTLENDIHLNKHIHIRRWRCICNLKSK